MQLEVGADAPDFTLPRHNGDPLTLSSYRGQQAVVVAFHPATFTGG